jgi:hypothetical protein
MGIKTERNVNYRTMTILALIAGVFSLAFQFMPDGESLSFIVSIAALGSLIGGSKDYDERERQLHKESFKTAFEWLLLAMMAVYAFIVLSRWLIPIEGAALFLNSHWPGLIISVMCLLMGLAGFQRIRGEGST